MISLNVPFLPKTEIAAKANAFLTKYSLSSIPIDIELVVERDLGIHIVPYSYLKREYGVDGCSAYNGSTIYVDGYAYNQVTNRLRFTVAHELGHLILHKQYLQQVSWSSVEEWMHTLGQLNTKDIEFMEYQAHAFAGLVLVPQDELKIRFNEQLQEFQPQIQQARDNGLSQADYVGHLVFAIADRLSREFEVSREAITKSIRFDSLEQSIN